MTDFRAIEPLVQRVCDAAAEAIGRFYQLTHYPPYYMHESFMASYVFDQLGEKISMMPEVPIGTLRKWNETSLTLAQGLTDQRRIDLVLFTPETNKEDQSIRCLIEFKRADDIGKIEADIYKVRSALRSLGEVHFGAACGVVDIKRNPDWLDSERRKSEARGMRFVTSKPCDIPIADAPHPFVVFAYLFAANAT